MNEELRNLTQTLLGETLSGLQENIRIHQEELLMQNEELRRIIATQDKIVIKLKEKTDKTENHIHELEKQVRGLEALLVAADTRNGCKE